MTRQTELAVTITILLFQHPAVKDYVDNNGGDGLILRSALTSGSNTIDIGTVPNVSGRTYYADKIVIKISTAFSGGSFNHILVKENGGSGNTLVASRC